MLSVDRCVCLLAAMFLLGGCSNRVEPARLSSSQDDYDNGVQAFALEDYLGAKEAFSKVISAGVVSPDAIAEAYLLRAESSIRLDDLESAREDLKAVAPAAPDMARWHALQGQLELAAGNTEAARTAYAEARKINPKLTLPEELR